MNRELLSKAVGCIDARYVAEASDVPTRTAGGPSERIVHMKKKRIVSFAIAAVLMLTLGVAVYAAYDTVATPQAAEKVALQQLAEWRELGLISEDIVFDRAADRIVESREERGGESWYGRLFPHSFSVQWHLRDEKYGCVLNIDTLEGKIMFANFFANANEDEAPTDEVELTVGKDGETKTFYYYENYDDLVPAEETVDEFCSALAKYWGYSGYHLACESDAVYTEEYAAAFAAVEPSTRLLDVAWDRTGRCFLAVYFEGDPDGAPVYLDMIPYPGFVGLDVGIRHPVG